MALPEEQRKRLEKLKAKRYENHRIREINRLKENMISDIPDFAERYEFANDIIHKKLDSLADKLPFRLPARIDFEKMPFYRKVKEEDINKSTKIWIYFLSGSSELFEISVYTSFDDYFSDYDIWYSYSPYLLLICENFEEFFYIDDDGNITQSSFKKQV